MALDGSTQRSTPDSGFVGKEGELLRAGWELEEEGSRQWSCEERDTVRADADAGIG